MSRPTYIEARRHLREQRAGHRIEMGAACKCLTCRGIPAVVAELNARRAAEAKRIGEAPF